jgi:hypothetical protein
MFSKKIKSSVPKDVLVKEKGINRLETTKHFLRDKKLSALHNKIVVFRELPEILEAFRRGTDEDLTRVRNRRPEVFKLMLEIENSKWAKEANKNGVSLGPESLTAISHGFSFEFAKELNAMEEEKINEEFVHGFVRWIQGESEDEEVLRKSWWWWTGNNNDIQRNLQDNEGRYTELAKNSRFFKGKDKRRLVGDDFNAYLDLFVERKIEFQKKMTLLKNFIPANINDAWLYWKYVIHELNPMETDFMKEYFDDFYHDNPNETPMKDDAQNPNETPSNGDEDKKFGGVDDEDPDEDEEKKNEFIEKMRESKEQILKDNKTHLKKMLKNEKLYTKDGLKNMEDFFLKGDYDLEILELVEQVKKKQEDLQAEENAKNNPPPPPPPDSILANLPKPEPETPKEELQKSFMTTLKDDILDSFKQLQSEYDTEASKVAETLSDLDAFETLKNKLKEAKEKIVSIKDRIRRLTEHTSESAELEAMRLKKSLEILEQEKKAYKEEINSLNESLTSSVKGSLENLEASSSKFQQFVLSNSGASKELGKKALSLAFSVGKETTKQLLSVSMKSAILGVKTSAKATSKIWELLGLAFEQMNLAENSKRAFNSSTEAAMNFFSELYQEMKSDHEIRRRDSILTNPYRNRVLDKETGLENAELTLQLNGFGRYSPSLFSLYLPQLPDLGVANLFRFLSSQFSQDGPVLPLRQDRPVLPITMRDLARSDATGLPAPVLNLENITRKLEDETQKLQEDREEFERKRNEELQEIERAKRNLRLAEEAEWQQRRAEEEKRIREQNEKIREAEKLREEMYLEMLREQQRLRDEQDREKIQEEPNPDYIPASRENKKKNKEEMEAENEKYQEKKTQEYRSSFITEPLSVRTQPQEVSTQRNPFILSYTGQGGGSSSSSRSTEEFKPLIIPANNTIGPILAESFQPMSEEDLRDYRNSKVFDEGFEKSVEHKEKMANNPRYRQMHESFEKLAEDANKRNQNDLKRYARSSRNVDTSFAAKKRGL